ncbi:DUF998 domain-containing protein [Halobaculum rubrum]|uniref:DUF998 domain-containing protein n=1 Tax=Halobaculum rubrum TaxID=2872158 RepID=UPI001CED1F73|nr:DUF998 domain-containing protein [Halobaculum rubrum]
MTNTRRRVAAASGAGAMIAALGGIAVAVALAPWFSVTTNALSDLGVADRAAVATAFNGGLLLGGAVALAYAWALWAAAGTRGARLVAVEFGVAALLMAGVGAFPSGTSLHFPVALGFYLVVTLVLATDGAVRRTTTAGRLALAAAGVHVAQWWFWIAGVRFGSGLAIPELVGALVLAAWVLALSPVAPLTNRVPR